MGGMLAYFIAFLLGLLSYSLVRRGTRKPWQRARLPPGSMGWPYLGETPQLYSQDPNIFFANKQERYGEIFKSHILGCPCVMLASPEAAKFVLATQAHMFKPTYPKSKENLIGPSALFFHQGDYHLRLRKLIQGSLSPDALRALVPSIDSLAVSLLNSWASGRVINAFQEMKKFSFEVGILLIFGHLDARHREELRKNYCQVDKGYNSFPTNIPGTPYKKALLARKRLSTTLCAIISERKERRLVGKDVLGCLLNYRDEKGEVLSDDRISDNIIGVLFAAQDTIASAMTWILKYLHDDPKLLEAVKAEQKIISETKNKGGNRSLTWMHTRNMPLTYKVSLSEFDLVTLSDSVICSLPWLISEPSVLLIITREDPQFPENKHIFKHRYADWPQQNQAQCMKFFGIVDLKEGQVVQESLRMASIISFTFREAVADVEYKGYLIPKGWKVMPLFRNIHHNPEFFPDPQRFDPSRFEVTLKPNTFMPFGSGVHACPGNELAKLEILIIIHHLVTKFRWHVVGSHDGIQYCPFPVPMHGLPARFSKESTS